MGLLRWRKNHSKSSADDSENSENVQGHGMQFPMSILAIMYSVGSGMEVPFQIFNGYRTGAPREKIRKKIENQDNGLEPKRQ
jgi:hypothetical protein